MAGMSRVREWLAAGAAHSVRKRPVVAAESELRVRTSAPARSERNSITGCKNKTKFPSTQRPLDWSGKGLGSWSFPSAVHDQCTAHIEIRQASVQPQIE